MNITNGNNKIRTNTKKSSRTSSQKYKIHYHHIDIVANKLIKEIKDAVLIKLKNSNTCIIEI